VDGGALARVIGIASQKGGVGKTTTAVNLGAYLALAGERVLLIDLDPQGNATSGVSAAADETALERLWEGNATWESVVSETQIPHLSVLSSSQRPEIPRYLEDLRSRRISELRAELDQSSSWDLVLIDAPPSLGPLTSLALAWADSVLIPVQCEYFAMEGLAQMIALIRNSDAGRSRPLQLAGILLTLFEHDRQLAVDVVEEVRKFFPQEVLESIIPRDVDLAEATSHGQPVCVYAPRSRGAWAYLNLAKELRDHECAQTR